MPAGVTRTLTPSVSQSTSYDSTGNAEDFSPILTNIAPKMTKFLSAFGEAPDGVATDFGWLTEGLEPPKQNAHLEKTDYTTGKVGSIEGLKNYHQYFINSGYVTDVQRKTKKLYNGDDDFSREQTHAFTKQAQDIEYAFVNGDVARAESGSDAALMGGVPYFMEVSNLSATYDTDTDIVTCASAHGMQTGDFVYFLATTMPTGLVASRMYYIRLDATTPATKFTIFDTMKDAVEGITANQVLPSTAGTALKVVKNNVISLGGSADYTLDDINNAMEMAYNRGGDPTEAYMSGRKKQRFSQLVNAISGITRQRGMKEKSVAEVATTYEGDFGVVNAQAHRMYGDNRIDILDLNYWDIKWFDRTHEVKDLAKKGSYKEFVIESRVGLQATQPKASCSIVDVKR